MNPFANMKEWPAVGRTQVIRCRWEQRAFMYMLHLTSSLIKSHLGHCTFSFFQLSPQYGLLTFSAILCPLNPLISMPTKPLAPALSTAAVPSQFFLAFGESYFLLLEYHRSRGMPMEGRVITPNAAQSSWRFETRRSKWSFKGEYKTVQQNLILRLCYMAMLWIHTVHIFREHRAPMQYRVNNAHSFVQHSHNVGRSGGQTPSEPGCLPGLGRWCSQPAACTNN